MKKIFFPIFACFILVLLISCNSDVEQTTQEQNKPPTQAPSNPNMPPPPPANASTLDTANFITTDIPVIDIAKLQYAYENANLMDVIFYNLPMSINQNNKAQIQTTLGLISPNKPKFKPPCTALGRIFFYNGAETLLEAEIYYGGTCYYYKFYENGKVIGNNNMNMQGVNFFANILKQSEAQRPK